MSSATVGTGPVLGNTVDVVYDDVTNPTSPRLLVSDAELPPSQSAIVAVDIATGNRTTL